MSLRNRFTVLFVAFAILATALEGVLAWNAASRQLEESLEHRLLDVAGVAHELVLGVDEALLLLEPGAEDTDEWREIQSALQRLVTGFVDGADVFRWMPGDRVARVVATPAPADSVGIGQELSWVQPYVFVEVPEAYRNGFATTTLAPAADGQVYKYGIRRIADGAFLGVRMRADYLETLDTLRWTIVGLSLGAAGLAALFGWRLAGGIVGRLETLSRAALRIQRGWMDRPVTLDGEDELSRLARAMERMRSGIQRRDEQMRLMLSQVAHEIRNPLGGLELFSAAAIETEDREERRRILERVRKEVVGLNGVINEFLGYARPGESKVVLHDVREPVREAVALAELELDSKGGELHLDLPATPVVASADPQQVKRLVLNLLRNAAHAGTTVWVDVARRRGEVRVSVRDDGPGVPEELRERIFEPFVGDKEQGAGLGLAIVRKLVEANYGRVELMPRPTGSESIGKGAEFHVYLRGSEDLPTADVQRQGSRGGRK